MSNTGKRIPVNSRRARGLTWQRISFVTARVVLLTCAIAGIGVIAVKASHPYRLSFSLRQELAADRSRSEALRADNERLLRRIDFLKTEEGKVALMREQGYHNPDEHPVRTQEPAEMPPPNSRGANPPATETTRP